ncbi:MAG: hypothetical protein GY822_32325 [Deltaproteobacteria bacterium]|nr:hypothetical protein [Deltaproteobacteria bacterium]
MMRSHEKVGTSPVALSLRLSLILMSLALAACPQTLQAPLEKQKEGTSRVVFNDVTPEIDNDAQKKLADGLTQIGLPADAFDVFSHEPEEFVEDRPSSSFSVEPVTVADAFPMLDNYLSIESGGVLATIAREENNSYCAAENVTDGASSTYWRAFNTNNDLIYDVNSGGNEACFDGFYLENYGNSYSVKRFSVLTSADPAMQDNLGTVGWTPIVADAAPTGDMNYLLWDEGGRISSSSFEENSGIYATANLNDGNTNTYWRSYAGRIDEHVFRFDRDWDGQQGEAVSVSKLELLNYGDGYSVERFQVELKTPGNDYALVAVPGTAAGDADHRFSSSHEGAKLERASYVDGSYAAERAMDDNDITFWRTWNNKINELDLSYDVDMDGVTGKDGDADDRFALSGWNLDATTGTYSAKHYQVEVQQGSTTWNKIPVPGTTAGDVDFNHASRFEGGVVTDFSNEGNDSSNAANNALDENQHNLWLSYTGPQNLDISFDGDLDGQTAIGGDTGDSIDMAAFQLLSPNSIYAVRFFQVLQRKAGEASFTPIPVPGTAAGYPDHNFANRFLGGTIASVSGEENATSLAALNAIDENPHTVWRFPRTVQELTLAFDADLDGTTGAEGDVDDLFTVEKVALRNTNSTRAVNKHQIFVETSSSGGFVPLEVPGTAINDADFNFSSRFEGGELTRIDSEENSGSLAAANLFDDNPHTYWRSFAGRVNEIDLTWDTNFDGTSAKDGDSADAFTLKRFQLDNYNSDNSVKNYQVLVRVDGSSTWNAVPVPGAVSPTNLLSQFSGGVLERVTHEEASYPAINAHDDNASYWRHSSGAVSEIDFTFDTDGDGLSARSGDVDDVHDLSGFVLTQVGNSYSVKDFQIEVETLTSGGFEPIAVPGTSPGDVNFSHSLAWEGGVVVSATSDGNVLYVPANAINGNPYSSWRGYSSVVNEMVLSFDGNRDGQTAQAGDANDDVDVTGFVVETPDSSYRISAFTAFTQLEGDPAWHEVNVPGSTVGDADFNYLSTWEGGRITSVTSSGDEEKLHDGNFASYADFTGAAQTIEFAFDPDLDGSTGDLINFATLRLHNYDSTRGLASFEIDVFASGSWDAVPSPAGGTLFSAAQSAGPQDFVLPMQAGVSAVRLRTLTTHGSSSLRVYELELFGESVGPSRTFNIPDDGSTRFSAQLDATLSNVQQVRFEMLRSKSGSRTQASAVEVLGTAKGPSHVFSGGRQGNVEVTPDATLVDVIGVRYRPISNHGGSRVGLRELAALDTTSASNTVFTAPRDGQHDVVLDTPIADVVEARVRFLSQYGGSRVAARDFRLLGDALGPAHVFSAAQNATTTHTLPVPVDNVEQVKLAVISNHGGGQNYLAELSVLGPSLSASNIFEAQKGEDFRVDLPATLVGVDEVRLQILVNHGGWRNIVHDFKVLGPAKRASYTFIAQKDVVDSIRLPDTLNDVTQTRLRVQSNHDGDRMAVKQFDILGPALGPTHTFEPPDTGTTTYFLPSVVEDVTHARLRTIDAHGGSRIALREFRLIGDAVGPSYVFSAEQANRVYGYEFDDLSAREIRFHAIDNFGGSRMAARDIALVSSDGGCPSFGPTILLSAGDQSPQNTIGRGQSDEPLLQVRMFSSTEAITNLSLRLQTTGTADEFSDTTGVRIYHDVNGDGVVDADDTEVGADILLEDNGSASFSLGSLPAMTERFYLVALDLNINPANNKTFQGFVGPFDVTGTGATSGLPTRTIGIATGDVLRVIDAVAPFVVAPATKGWEATSPDGRLVRLSDLGSATATDDGNGSVIMKRRLANPSGAVLRSGHWHQFPLGTTLVYWVASDDAGNEGYAYQQIRIVDTASPTIAAVATTTHEAVSPLGTPVTLPAYDVSDIADAFPVVTTDAPDLFALGDTTVTVMATDSSSNVGERTHVVKVVDTTPPIFVEADGAGVLPIVTTGFIPSQIVLPEPVVTDNGYGSSLLSLTVLTSAPNSPGLVSVLWKAEDPAGNTSFATQDVYFLSADEALVIDTVLLNKNRPVAFGEYHSANFLDVTWEPQGVAPYSYAFNVVPDEISVDGSVHRSSYSDEKKYAPVLGHFTDSDAIPKFNFKLAFFGIDRTFPVVEQSPLFSDRLRLTDSKTYEKLFYGESIDISGFEVSDVLGNGISGMGSMVLEFNASGPAEKTLAFDGETFVTVSHDPILEPTDEFTLEAWIRSDNAIADEGRVILMKGDATSGTPANAGFVFYLDKGKVAAALSDGVVSDGLIGGTSVVDGEWHHIALVREIRTELNGIAVEWSLVLYIDGVADVQKAVESFDLVSAAEVRVGKGTGVNDGFIGHLDDVAIQKSALSAADLAQRFNNGIGLHQDPSGPTILLLHFDEDSGQDILDDSGWDFNGVLGDSIAVDANDPVREKPLGEFGDYERAAQNAIAIAGGTGVVFGPSLSTGISCDQSVASCPDGDQFVSAVHLGNELGKSIPHRVDLVGFDRAGNAGRSSTIVVVDDLEGMIEDAIEFIDLSLIDFDYLLVQPNLHSARVHLQVARRYLNLSTTNGPYRYVGGATLRVAKAVQGLETARAMLFADPKAEVERISLNLARAVLGDSRVRVDELRSILRVGEQPLVDHADTDIANALAFRANGLTSNMLLAGRATRDEVALLINEYASYRDAWLDAEANPDDYDKLVAMVAEMTPLLVSVVDGQIEAVQNDPATPVQEQLQVVRDRIDGIRACTVLLEEFGLEDDEFVLCYLDFFEIGEVLQDVPANLVDTYAWKAGTAQVLFGLLRISLQLSPFSISNIIDGASLPAQADYDEALVRYFEVRALLDDGDIDGALEQFIADKCRVVTMYNRYYTPNSQDFIPNEDDNVSKPLDPVLDPTSVGCVE